MNPFMKMRMANKAKGSMRAEGDVIWLYDAIASDDDEAEWWGGISPRQFIAALKATTGPVTLRINSPGGSVFGAQAMVAAMRAHSQPITAQVDSLAASAASVIACEAATLVMSPGAMLMIHKAWGVTVGNVDDHTATGELLQKIDGQIAETYARRGSASVDEFLALMAAETWFTVDEALAAGLCDAAIVENLQRPTSSDTAAKWDLSGFQNAPAMIAPAPSVQGANDPLPDTSKDLAQMRVRSLAARLCAPQF
jgi:ATP-dependent Clp protease protease subunit